MQNLFCSIQEQGEFSELITHASWDIHEHIWSPYKSERYKTCCFVSALQNYLQQAIRRRYRTYFLEIVLFSLFPDRTETNLKFFFIFYDYDMLIYMFICMFICFIDKDEQVCQPEAQCYRVTLLAEKEKREGAYAPSSGQCALCCKLLHTAECLSSASFCAKSRRRPMMYPE